MNYLRIKELLDRDKRKIPWLSEETGINRNALYKMSKGDTTKIEFETIEKLLNALDCQLEELFNFKK